MVIIAVLWFLLPVLIFQLGIFSLETINALKSIGSVGDSFGILNSLFTGIALAGIITAIILQNKQLEIQSKELEKTTNHLEKEDEWNRVKLKMEVLPLLVSENYSKIKQLINTNDFEYLEDIEKAENRTKLLSDIEGKINETAIQIELNTDNYERIRQEALQADTQFLNSLNILKKHDRSKEENIDIADQIKKMGEFSDLIKAEIPNKQSALVDYLINLSKARDVLLEIEQLHNELKETYLIAAEKSRL